MPPAPRLPVNQGPRLILYHQTTHDGSGNPVSILPLITNNTGVTHVVVAAIHLNDGPGNITLNDDRPDAPRFNTLWSEVAWLQGAGVKVLGMLGGAAKGSYAKLSGSDDEFEAYYLPLATLIRLKNLQGLDLDVEEEIDISTILRLILRLRADFGSSFIITMAPVATALLPNLPHLSGFNYFELEATLAALQISVTETGEGQNEPVVPLVSWYNTQFYCGWGDASTTAWYDAIISAGWPADKVVMGVVTNPGNGSGHIQLDRLGEVCRVLRTRYPTFGGVMGWEYFNSGLEREGARGPWDWAGHLGGAVRATIPPGTVEGGTGLERPGVGAHRPGLPRPMVPWPAEDVEKLTALGFGRMDAVAALNATGGNVELAAGVLFDN